MAQRQNLPPGGREPNLGRVVLEELRDAEVEELHSPFAGHEDIGGLQVAVNDELLVSELDGRGHFEEELQPVRDAELTLDAIVRTRLPCYELHHEVGRAVRVVPPSRRRAMPGCSSRARICLSCRKRLSLSCPSDPGRSTFTATCWTNSPSLRSAR